MSRIGNKLILIPKGVTVNKNAGVLTIKGEKGILKVSIPDVCDAIITEDELKITRSNDQPTTKALHGTTRAHANNAVTGVSKGFEKKLEFIGSGYSAKATDRQVELHMGYTDTKYVEIPEGITVKVQKNMISVTGINKELVGAVAANIRAVRKPEPYKGKGIRYVDEYVIRKVGKALKGTEA